jgi:choline dehydrogenase-like flavoprotein
MSSDGDFDICIIGAGAAGTVLAELLSRTGHSLLLIDRGPHQASASSKSSTFSAATAHRVFGPGGNTNVWGNICKELDDADFIERCWVPGSGWPIDKKILMPFYPYAWERCGFGGTRQSEPRNINRNIETTSWEILSPSKVIRVDGGGHLNRITDVFCERLNFAEGRATSLTAYRDGRQVSYTSRIFVIACGALESTLLFARSVAPFHPGLLNEIVGRNLMDHYRFTLSAELSATALELLEGIFAGSEGKSRLGVKTTLNFQRNRGLLSAAAYLGRSLSKDHKSTVEIVFEVEPEPLSDNRVDFGDLRDVESATCLLEMGGLTRHTILHTANEVLDLVGLGGAGTLSSLDIHLRSIAHNFQGIGHPAGTLRMGEASRTAIVDRNLRTFAFPNLFVLSTAVFPTIGHAQPTLTLVALAARLANHIEQTCRD